VPGFGWMTIDSALPTWRQLIFSFMPEIKKLTKTLYFLTKNSRLSINIMSQELRLKIIDRG